MRRIFRVFVNGIKLAGAAQRARGAGREPSAADRRPLLGTRSLLRVSTTSRAHGATQ